MTLPVPEHKLQPPPLSPAPLPTHAPHVRYPDPCTRPPSVLGKTSALVAVHAWRRCLAQAPAAWPTRSPQSMCNAETADPRAKMPSAGTVATSNATASPPAAESQPLFSAKPGPLVMRAQRLRGRTWQ
jgi:hypothetical protein